MSTYCSSRSNVTRPIIGRPHVSILLACITVVLISTLICSAYQIGRLWERLSLCVVQGQQRNDSQGNLKTVNGNFPAAISTTFIPACASYFLSSSACFLLDHSYCSSITIVPSFLKRDIVYCEDNIQFVSSHPKHT